MTLEITYSRETRDLHLHMQKELGTGKTFSRYFVKADILFLGDELWQKDIPHKKSGFVFNFLFTLV